MCRISRDVNATHPRVNEDITSLVLIGDWHDVGEGIVVESAAFDAVKGGQTGCLEQMVSPTYKFPKSMYVYVFRTESSRGVRCDQATTA